MEVEEETQEGVQYEEEASEESVEYDETERENEPEEYVAPGAAGAVEKEREVKEKNLKLNNQGEDRGSFVYGLSVGLGIGCIATFVIMWITVFFTPQLPSTVTYENLLSIFIYPFIYLLTIGLIALTAGIVREYYSSRNRF